MCIRDRIGDGIALEGNLPLEIFWTAVPAIVVLFVGLFSYDIYERIGGMVPLGHGGHGDSQATEERVWGGIGTAGAMQASSEMLVPPLPV